MFLLGGCAKNAARQVAEQLELGQRYLEEGDYEAAIVAFNKAIEIDPMSVDAYIGLADAYENLGDIEEAVKVLQAGYELTDDTRLKDIIDRLGIGNEVKTQAEENTDSDNAERINELK